MSNVSIAYDGAILATMAGPDDRHILKAFLSHKFNAIAEILDDHRAEIDMGTLSPITYSVAATVPDDRLDSLTAALTRLEFTVQPR